MKRFIAVSVLLLSFTGSASATPFTNIFNFGDSFSDTGNFAALTGSAFNPPPFYAPGRFTGNFTGGSDDGVVFYDVLTNQLGFSSTNSLSGGTNYAWAGALTGPNTGNTFFPPTMLDQTQTFLSDMGGVADSNALYSIFGGGNDIRHNVSANSVSNISSIITQLSNAGAKHFFLPNLPDIGLTPESRTGGLPTGTPAEKTVLTEAYNNDLHNEVQLLKANLGINIIEFDIYSLFNSVILTPADFGFTNVTEACFDQSTPSLCADPDSYLFFDGIHPTAAAHTLLGNLAFASIISAIPTPATLALLLSGLAILGFRRKKA